MLLVFFLSCFIGTLLSAVIFMFCANITLMVAGQKNSLISSVLFIKGFFVTFPLVCVISSILLVFYSIRHSYRKNLTFCMYAICVLLSWTVLMPVVFAGRTRLGTDNVIVASPYNLSADYFREDAAGIYYYSRVFRNNEVDGLYIDKLGSTGRPGKVSILKEQPADLAITGPYRDIIIRDSVQMSPLLKLPIEIYVILYEKGMLCIKSGYLHWLIYASIALCFIAAFAFINFSSWNLLNIFSIILSIVGCAFVNSYYYRHLSDVDYLVSAREQLVKLVNTDEPFLLIVNIAIFIVMGSYGIGMAIFRKNHLAESIMEN